MMIGTSGQKYAGAVHSEKTRTSASLNFNCIAKGAVEDTRPEPREQ
jgi:hypothetical protein